MRISSNLFFQTGLNSINAQQADMVHLYKQVGSGKRMVAPSDDPLAAAQAINVSQTLAMSERYAANRAVANRNLGMEENILNSVTLQLQDVKTRLVEAGNGSLSDIDRETLADVLSVAREGLMNLANSTDGNGQYLFSGAAGKTPSFNSNGEYEGSPDARLIQVDQTRQMDSADIGSKIFGAGDAADPSLFQMLDDVITALNTSGDETAFRDALGSAASGIGAIYDNILSVRASAGTRMNELSALDSSGAGRIMEYKNQLSQLEDLDYYTAITQLQLRTTALEAAAMAFQKIQNTSLFNMNR